MSIMGLAPRARSRGAPKMFHYGVASREQYREDTAFFVESARPIRIVRHDGDSVGHRSELVNPPVTSDRHD